MALGSGKSVRKQQKIRLKSVEAGWLFRQGEQLSRPDALRRACNDLERASSHADPTEAIRLIALFNIGPEELSEAGLPYESLRALDQRGIFL